MLQPVSTDRTRSCRDTPVIVGSSAIDLAVARLDAWFETMRGAGGYAGPVAHWWQQCLVYTGTGLDWRYEGLIAGYLQLWRRSGQERWLAKACRAGKDLAAGQLENGHYPASAFELNPASAGTPHEAACDVGLLLLAQALREAGRDEWQRYATCAERNLRACYINRLWDNQAGAFRDDPQVPSFVPNKAATACEALFLLAELSQDDTWVTLYAIPTLNRILEHQVAGEGLLDGAIAQNSFGARRVEKYFPIYIARCVPALLRGYRWTGDERYVEGALRALRFVARWSYADGSFPTVIYPTRRVNRYPAWVAPLGDVLRAADELRPYGFAADLRATEQRLLDGQQASGGFATAVGFAAQVSQRLPDLPDLRDLLPVVGWCDKAFRYLAAHAGPDLPAATIAPVEVPCLFGGQELRLIETDRVIEAVGQGGVRYRWHKGATWPEIAAPEFWLR